MAQGLRIKPTNAGQTLSPETDYTYTDGVLTVKTTTAVTISSNGTETSDCIAVADGMVVTITLENVNIKKTDGCPFDIQGNASVTLILVGVNKLTSDYSNSGDNPYPVLRCESKDGKTASLEIQGEGELIATALSSIGSDPAGAGIGGGKGASGGHITIAGGVVTASSHYGAGIGGGAGEYGNIGALNGGTIRITGGMVTASSRFGAGIGGGN